MIEKELVKDPDSNPVHKGKFAGLRKHRVGDFNVIYSIDDDDVLILRIADHKNVYRHEF